MTRELQRGQCPADGRWVLGQCFDRRGHIWHADCWVKELEADLAALTEAATPVVDRLHEGDVGASVDAALGARIIALRAALGDDCPGCGAPAGFPPAGPCANHGTEQASADSGTP